MILSICRFQIICFGEVSSNLAEIVEVDVE
jgi:hypothetical protein